MRIAIRDRRYRMLASVCALACTAVLLPAATADEVTHDRLLKADSEPGNWLLHHKNFAAHRFSSLNEINRDEVTADILAWLDSRL